MHILCTLRKTNAVLGDKNETSIWTSAKKLTSTDATHAFALQWAVVFCHPCAGGCY